jgi:hypothetical protein
MAFGLPRVAAAAFQAVFLGGGAGQTGEVAARREADGADAVGVDLVPPVMCMTLRGSAEWR